VAAARTGRTPGTDLPALRDELAEGRDVFVVDDPNANRFCGGRVLRALATARLAAVAAGFSCHDVIFLLGGNAHARRELKV
jgi:hypothetical protein